MLRKVQQGFTLIELLVVAPVAIITTAVLISLMVTLVGDVAVSRERSVSAYDVQDALDRIEQDARIATTFMPNFSLFDAPQGKNDSTGAFSSGSDDLIISQYATTKDPYDTTRQIVYYADQPYSCGSTYTRNRPLTVRVIYFTKVTSGVTSLWRRVIVPPGSTADTGTTKLCQNPWQRDSCSASFISNPICDTRDELILDYVSNFSTTYYSSSGAVTTDVRQAASIKVNLSQTKSVAGESITTTGIGRASHVNVTTDDVPETPSIYVYSPDINAYNNPVLTTFEWGVVTNASVYTVRYQINGGSWVNAPNQTDNRFSVSEARPLDVINIRVAAMNDMGKSTEATLSHTKPLWTYANLEGDWGCYDEPEATYACPSYTLTATGVVVFRGLASGGSESTPMFTLPTGVRPKSTKRMTYPSLSSAKFGRIDLNGTTHGKVTWFNGAEDASSGYVSLDNVQFLGENATATMSTLAPTSANGWTQAGGQWGNLEYTRDSVNRVWVVGRVCGASTVATGTSIAKTPAGFQFSNTQTGMFAINVAPDSYGAVQTIHGTTGADIQSRATGTTGACQNGWANLALMGHGPSSTAGTASIALATGWSNYSSGWHSTAARKHSSESLVTLTGLVKYTDTTSDLGAVSVATLPSGYRPSKRMIFMVPGTNPSATPSNVLARIDIYPSGLMQLVDLGSGRKVRGGFLSFDGISYIADGS